MRHLTKLLLSAVVVAAASFAPVSASAATTSGTFGVSATVSNNCVLSPTTSVDLGAYDPTSGSQVSGTATITVKCTKSTSYTTTLQSANSWNLHSASGDVPYVIYQPAANGTGATSTAWDNTHGPVVVAGSNATRDMTATIRPSIGSDVPAGAYSDTVTITVTW